MYKSTHRDLCERQAVAHVGSDARTGLDNLTDLQSIGGDDVLLHTVFIFYESDTGAAVGIVLNGLYGSLHIVLVAEEIDHTVHPLVSATTVANGHLTGVVPSTCALERFKQRFVGLLGGNFVKSADSLVPLTGSRRLEFSDCHCLVPP